MKSPTVTIALKIILPSPCRSHLGHMQGRPGFGRSSQTVPRQRDSQMMKQWAPAPHALEQDKSSSHPVELGGRQACPTGKPNCNGSQVRAQNACGSISGRLKDKERVCTLRHLRERNTEKIEDALQNKLLCGTETFSGCTYACTYTHTHTYVSTDCFKSHI